MISQIRHSYFTKLLWGLMGLFLLNISVDSADPNPEYIPEDLSINDQESIIELVVEQVLGYADAIKEYDDHDSDNHNQKKQVKIDLLIQFVTTSNDDSEQFTHKKRFYPDYDAGLSSGFKEIDSPPPKV